MLYVWVNIQTNMFLCVEVWIRDADSEAFSKCRVQNQIKYIGIFPVLFCSVFFGGQICVVAKEPKIHKNI
jgi:hypothetical protein